ncbi:Major facilitator superfamily domain general substrate transporter [Penicillium nucicola]|uniref:Major facilitator superfamily domain general substrate transporter n=1 Tax=Penicillium nucicola TaxID=1850975 RepID=UPI002544FDE6|nr:Major facilitator superfamily domain general substrate transporter [Penicillium nucicola]KAJ5753660.1 Major facilitator superfamily domain general substrate transporter [Penicillium nucicola]
MTFTDKSTTPTTMSKPNEEVMSSLGAAEKAEPQTKPANFSSTFHEAIFILIIGMSQLFSVGGLGVDAYSIEQIGTALGTNSNSQMSWFLASYSLCGGVFVLVTGRLGDHFGHKYVFLFGWIWMAIWSVVCGFAHDVVLFDIARGMMGIGNGALVPNSFALLARAFPPLSVKKNIAFAFLGFCAPSGYIFGGLIGAAFGQKVTWRWGFWFWALGCLILSMATFVVVPHRIGSPIPGLSLRQFDYVGSLLGVSALILFSFAWSQASVVGWQEPYIYALLIVSVFLLVAFIFSQSRVFAPVLPNSLWRRPGFAPVVSAMAFGWMSFGIFLYYTTIYILTIHKARPLAAVAQMVPLVIGGLFATTAVGLFIAKTPAQYIFGVSMFSFFIGNLLMSFVNYSNVYWAFIFPACLLVVGGPDLSFASSGILISNAVLPEEQGVAGSFISTVVQYSISIGLGIAATVESHVNEGGKNPIRGYRGAFWLGIGFATVAFFIVIFFVRDPRFEAKEEDQSPPEAIFDTA